MDRKFVTGHGNWTSSLTEGRVQGVIIFCLGLTALLVLTHVAWSKYSILAQGACYGQGVFFCQTLSDYYGSFPQQ